jgi:hypothetical protein
MFSERALLDEGLQRHDLDVGAQIDVRILERAEDLGVLAARLGGKIDGAHGHLATQCQRILSNQRIAVTRQARIRESDFYAR